MNNKSMLVAAGGGGLVMLFLTKVPLISCLNCLFCAGIWGGGILTIWFYRLSEKDHPGLTVGQGALLGILAGVVAAVLATAVGAVFSGAGALSSLDTLQNIPGVSNQIPSASTDAIRQAAALGGGFFGGLICNLVLYPLFGALGGVIGTGLIWKK
jgi:hypothetical protein